MMINWVVILLCLTCSIGIFIHLITVLLQNEYIVKEIEIIPEFSLASYYSDHMVLQRAPQSSYIWGYAGLFDIDDEIVVEITRDLDGARISEQFVYVYQAENGEKIFSVKLKPVEAGGPYTVTFKSSYPGNKILALRDVLFGDVWLCGGQSNMQFGVSMMKDAASELINSSRYKNIRLFDVKMVTSEMPLRDLEDISLPWSLPSNASLGNGWTYFSAVCYVYGRVLYDNLQIPIGLVESTWGGTQIEQWVTPSVLKSCAITNQKSYSKLWNAMIHPLLNMTLTGVVWYQGEANQVINVHAYNCTFPRMISDWRRAFHYGSSEETQDDFPFGFVQLGPYRRNVIGGFPEIRWHQTSDVGYVPNDKMKHVFMATAIDDADGKSTYGSIHPRDKATIGYRLARSCLTQHYGKSLGPSHGPFPTDFKVSKDNKQLEIMFDHNTNTLELRSKIGFEVLCTPKSTSNPGVWKHENISSFQTSTSMISIDLNCKQSETVSGVRYLWSETPCDYMMCALYSKSYDLPALPFIHMFG